MLLFPTASAVRQRSFAIRRGAIDCVSCDVVDDGSDLLTLQMHTDGRELHIELTEEQQELASVEGWESLADFDPALFSEGALERWRLIRELPAEHDDES
jgi:hypothetical protein